MAVEYSLTALLCPLRVPAGEPRIRNLSISSQPLYHWAIALPTVQNKATAEMYK